MAKKCDFCGRGSRTKISRSNSNVANKKRQHINLQTRHINGEKVKICTKCLKTLKKKKQ